MQTLQQKKNLARVQMEAMGEPEEAIKAYLDELEAIHAQKPSKYKR